MALLQQGATQNQRAYAKVLAVFLQTPHNLEKDEALVALRSALKISDAQHAMVVEEAGASEARRQHQQLLRPAPAGPPVTAAHAPPRRSSASDAARKRKSDNASGRPPPRVRPSPPAASHLDTQRPRGAAAGDDAIDDLVGRKVLRNWPRDGGWFEGVVSDFNAVTGEHAIIYDLGAASESFEWYRVRGAPKEACSLLEQRGDGAVLAAAGGGRGRGRVEAPPKAASAPAARAAPAQAAEARPAAGRGQQGLKSSAAGTAARPQSGRPIVKPALAAANGAVAVYRPGTLGSRPYSSLHTAATAGLARAYSGRRSLSEEESSDEDDS